MPDTAKIQVDLGIPAGSPVCGRCRFDYPFENGYKWTRGCDLYRETTGGNRCPACLAAEQRFTDKPPTETGWYWLSTAGESPRIAYVREYQGHMCIDNWTVPYGPSVKWSGPIPMPGGGE